MVVNLGKNNHLGLPHQSEQPISSEALSIEDYDVGRLLGRGAFSEVHQARSRLTGDLIALKISNKKKMKELEEAEKKKQQENGNNQTKSIDFLLNIQKEIKIHRMLSSLSFSSSYIIKFIDTFEDSYNIYQCLEYLPHNNFFFFYNNYFKSQKLNSFTIVLFLSQVIKFLKFLFSHNIIYRDLKLSNILISDYPIQFFFNKKYQKDDLDLNESGEFNYYKSFRELENSSDAHNRGDFDSFYYIPIKFCDFNLSTTINHPDDELLTICGTLNYLSPEILTNSSYSYSSDIWSLGCLLYKLIFDEFPFQYNDYNIIHNDEELYFPPSVPSSSSQPRNKINLPFKIHPELETLLLDLLEINSSKRPHINSLFSGYSIFSKVPSDDFFRMNYIFNFNPNVTDQFYPQKMKELKSNTENRMVNESLISNYSVNKSNNISKDSLSYATTSTYSKNSTYPREISSISSSLSNSLSINFSFNNNQSIKPIARNLLNDFNSNLPNSSKCENNSVHSLSSSLLTPTSTIPTSLKLSINSKSNIISPSSSKYRNSDLNSIRNKYNFSTIDNVSKISADTINFINQMKKLKKKLSFSSFFYFEHNFNFKNDGNTIENDLFLFFLNFFSSYNENSGIEAKKFEKSYEEFKKNKLFTPEKIKCDNFIFRIIYENKILYYFSPIYYIIVDFNSKNFDLFYSSDYNDEIQNLTARFFSFLKDLKNDSIQNENSIKKIFDDLYDIDRIEVSSMFKNKMNFKIVKNDLFNFLVQGNFNFYKFFSLIKNKKNNKINCIQNSFKSQFYILLFNYLSSFLSIFILKDLVSYIIYFNNKNQEDFRVEKFYNNNHNFFSSLILNSSFNVNHFINYSTSLFSKVLNKSSNSFQLYSPSNFSSLFSLVKVHIYSNYSFAYFLPDFTIEFIDRTVVKFLFSSDILELLFNPSSSQNFDESNQQFFVSIPLISLFNEENNFNLDTHIITMFNIYSIPESHRERISNKFISVILLSLYIYEKIPFYYKENEEINSTNYPIIFNDEL